MKNPLMDKEFLYELNQFRHKEIYAKIISLTFEEHPLEQIEGKVTGGSINIDGASVVRRTCNLTLVASDVNITDFYWGVSNKFTLEIGLKNTINNNYPDIIWFPQGIYVITSFNVALTGNSYNISISGKDKMCLLNGDIGGNLYASVDFGKIDTYSDTYSAITIEDYTQYKANKYYIYDNGEWKISTDEYNKDIQYYTKDTILEQEDLKLKDIIREAVHTYGKEMYHNIIINDLDDYGLELLEYRGDQPLYMLYDEEASIYDQMLIEEEAKKLTVTTQHGETKTLVDCILNTAVDELNTERDIFELQIGVAEDNSPIYRKYSVSKIDYGHTAGYRTTDLIYAGDLISSIGESITSILDKIKSMLGAFEYFYDIKGHFVFQAKKIYSNESWNTLQDSDDNIFARDAIEESPYSYCFEDINLIQRFQNTPAIGNIKNDYSIWGVRKGASGAEIPIHARYAIHEKPKYYKGYDGIIYCSDPSVLKSYLKQKEKDILTKLEERLDNFELQYTIPTELAAPYKLADGSWSPGWWDIRDWHDYYVALTQEEPIYTMKWYSQNDITGCVPGYELNLNHKGVDSTDYVWLLIYNPKRDYYNTQHGSGDPYKTNPSLKTRYESYFDEDGELHTVKSNPLVQEYFMAPYKGCSDTHTYLEFLTDDVEKDGNYVYFYNPNFPGATSFEQVVQDQVQKEYEEWVVSGAVQFVDWREIIYQMAKDYYAHNQEEDFLLKVRENNVELSGLSSYYPNGETGYEMFYADIQGFWRQLYDPNPEITYDSEGGYYSEEKVYEADGISYKIVNTWNPFKELETFSCDYFLQGDDDSENYSTTKYYWNKNVVEAPELLNFWIDFYEGDAPLSQYSIGAIGDRPKVVNNNKVSSIYFRNVPQVIFYNDEDYDPLNVRTGYTYVSLGGMDDLFTISSQGKSAQDELNELFNNYAYCTEIVSMTSIPIYYLEPNTLVYIHDEESGINGKFQLTRLSIPLTYNGMMSITATKIQDQIYLGG